MAAEPVLSDRARLERALLDIESAARAAVANGTLEALRERLAALDALRNEIALRRGWDRPSAERTDGYYLDVKL